MVHLNFDNQNQNQLNDRPGGTSSPRHRDALKSSAVGSGEVAAIASAPGAVGPVCQA